jgi:hypothetical protein
MVATNPLWRAPRLHGMAKDGLLAPLSLLAILDVTDVRSTFGIILRQSATPN